jgi:hypothetical protein
VDAQRPYPTEPPPWYNERDEPQRGPRDPRYGEPYPDDPRYGDDPRRADDPHYADDSRYGDDQRYRDAYVSGYPGGDDARYDSGEHSFDVPDQRYDGDSGRGDRTGEGDRATRGGRARGMRSGLELPEDESDQTREESPRYRTEMLDRGALRRPADGGDLAGPPGGGPSGPLASAAAGSVAPGSLAPGSMATAGSMATPVPGLLGSGSPGGSNPAGSASGPPGSPPAVPGSPPSIGSLGGTPSSTVYQAGGGATQAIPATMPSPTLGGGLKEAYRARRSGIAWLFGTVAVVVEVLLLIKVLIDSVTAHPTNTGGVIAGVFAMCGVPMVALGLYGLATGAATAGGPNVGRAWLRTPLAYLPIGLILIIAAGLAT